jgi:undecaprenyl-diphosphatase
MGLGRDAAVRFAFLMGLPIIAGALVFKAVEANAEGGIPGDMLTAFFWGTVSSATTGYVAVWGMLTLVRSWSFASFVLYRLVLGLAALALLAMQFR